MGCGDVRLLKTVGSVDFTGQERAALNKLTMPWHELVTRADRQARVTLSVVGHVGPAELGHGLKDFRPGEARASALLLAADGGLRGSVACDNNLSP